jgi:hypothetical protein
MDFRLPSRESHASDVAVSASASGRKIVYAMDRGRAFMREKMDDEAYGPYGPWRDLGFTGGTVLAAGLTGDGRQQAFAISPAGEPLSAIQNSSEPNAPFGAWADFGGDSVPQLVDVDAGQTGADMLTLFALDTSGALWTRSLVEDSWGPWLQWLEPATPEPLANVSINPKSATQSDSLLVGLAIDGTMYATQNVETEDSVYAWGAWYQL